MPKSQAGYVKAIINKNTEPEYTLTGLWHDQLLSFMESNIHTLIHSMLTTLEHQD
jgi:hypothetical protein